VVDLVARCQSPKAITTFIDACVARLESVGSINALILLVTRIENPLDLGSLGIVRNEFIPPNSYIIVKLKGEYSGDVKIERSTTVQMFRAMIARLANAVESKI
jgi:hypothetical protein